jgi:hypothetical protein
MRWIAVLPVNLQSRYPVKCHILFLHKDLHTAPVLMIVIVVFESHEQP